MGIFQEYMSSNGKVEKAKVDISGDRTDPMTPPTKPPGEKGQNPYISNADKSKKDGLGDKGDKELIFNYDTKDSQGKKPANIPTVEQRFTHLEIIPLVCESLAKDPLVVENMVRELKQKGLLHLLVAEMMEHRETYHHLSELMKNETYGPNICRRLKNSMNEEVASPFHSQMIDDQDDMFPGEDEEDEDEIGADEDELDMMDFEDEDGLNMGDEFDEFDEFDEEPEFGEDEEMGLEYPMAQHPQNGPMNNQEMIQMMRRMMGKA